MGSSRWITQYNAGAFSVVRALPLDARNLELNNGELLNVSDSLSLQTTQLQLNYSIIIMKDNCKRDAFQRGVIRLEVIQAYNHLMLSMQLLGNIWRGFTMSLRS